MTMPKQRATYGQILGNVISTVQVAGLVGRGISALIPKAKPEFQKPPVEETHPMEGMAMGRELNDYRYQKHSLYLGEIHPDHETTFKAGLSHDSHDAIVAKTRSGKGTSFLVNNALHWGDFENGGGLVAVDPKGELASITAIRRGTQERARGTGTNVRQFIGRSAAILDPFNEVRGPARTYKVNYNPISAIDIKKREARAQISSLAEALIVPENGDNSHFSTNAETIAAGAIEFILANTVPKHHNLHDVRRFLRQSFEKMVEMFNRCHVRGGWATEAAAVLDEIIGTDEAGSYKTTLSKNLKWLIDVDMQEHLQTSDISMRQIIQERGSVYIVVPPSRVQEFQCWIRIILTQAIEAKEMLGTDQTTQHTLFMIDEFPLLGKFKLIEKGAAYLAGYNVKFLWAIQQISQLKTLYEKNWEAFFGSSGGIIIFATNDGETESYLSERMNKIMKWQTSYSVNQGATHQHGQMGGGFSDGKNVNQQQQLQSVRLPNEIHEQGAREQMRAFVITASGKTFTVKRMEYYKTEKDYLFDSPQQNSAWEAKYR